MADKSRVVSQLLRGETVSSKEAGKEATRRCRETETRSDDDEDEIEPAKKRIALDRSPGSDTSSSGCSQPGGVTTAEHTLYRLLLPNKLAEVTLISHGYPRPCGQPGKAKITERNPTFEDQRVCHRCKKNFTVSKEGVYKTIEPCRYHIGMWTQVFRGRGRYDKILDCCGQKSDSTGCKTAIQHVYTNKVSGVYDGYLETAPISKENDKFKVLAVGCEMIYTVMGHSIARLIVINYKGETVYDTKVKPSAEVVDYNTLLSGLREKDFLGVSTSLEDVHEWFRKNVNADMILIGHGLNYDLKALKIVHSKVVDTAFLFNSYDGELPALKSIAEEHLKQVIQSSGQGHDSTENARCCMRLAQKKVNWKPSSPWKPFSPWIHSK